MQGWEGLQLSGHTCTPLVLVGSILPQQEGSHPPAVSASDGSRIQVRATDHAPIGRAAHPFGLCCMDGEAPPTRLSIGDRCAVMRRPLARAEMARHSAGGECCPPSHYRPGWTCGRRSWKPFSATLRCGPSSTPYMSHGTPCLMPQSLRQPCFTLHQLVLDHAGWCTERQLFLREAPCCGAGG